MRCSFPQCLNGACSTGRYHSSRTVRQTAVVDSYFTKWPLQSGTNFLLLFSLIILYSPLLIHTHAAAKATHFVFRCVRSATPNDLLGSDHTEDSVHPTLLYTLLSSFFYNHLCLKLSVFPIECFCLDTYQNYNLPDEFSGTPKNT